MKGTIWTDNRSFIRNLGRSLFVLGMLVLTAIWIYTQVFLFSIGELNAGIFVPTFALGIGGWWATIDTLKKTS